jgi:hypothetical protein
MRRCGTDRNRGDEITAHIALGEVALHCRADDAIGRTWPGPGEELSVDRVERDRMVGGEDRLQLLVVVDAEVGQPVGGDRRLPLELDQLAAPLGVVDRQGCRHEERDHCQRCGEQHRQEDAPSHVVRRSRSRR